ncbi:hypothetical protein ACSVDA_06990 [Cytobacillus sp. Hm23]
MRIKVINSITDENGIATPYDMIGKEYDVIKKDQEGVWVRAQGKLDAFLYYEELEILELSDNLSNPLSHYFKGLPKDKYEEELASLGCSHLL